jgi:hypothetical protein
VLGILGSMYRSIGYCFLVLVHGTGLVTLYYQLYVLVPCLHVRSICSTFCLSYYVAVHKHDINTIHNQCLLFIYLFLV